MEVGDFKSLNHCSYPLTGNGLIYGLGNQVSIFHNSKIGISRNVKEIVDLLFGDNKGMA